MHGLQLGVPFSTVLDMLGPPRYWQGKRKGGSPAAASFYEYPFLNLFFKDGFVDCITVVLRDGLQADDPLLFDSEMAPNEFTALLVAERINFEWIPEGQRHLGACLRTDANVIVFARPLAESLEKGGSICPNAPSDECYVDTAVLSSRPLV